MSPKRNLSTVERITVQKLYAQLYDVRVRDWQGEVGFYRELISQSALKSSGVLEVACETGRITLQLAKDRVNITGLDISSDLLAIARGKSNGMSNINWVLGYMRTFEIGEKFGCVILPGHSFQFMLTPDEQVQCLEQIKHHLIADGLLVLHLDHQDFSWLAGLLKQKEPTYEKGEVLTHPVTGQKFRQAFAWTFEPTTQTATIKINWEEIDENGKMIQMWEMEPMRLHCCFRFEMEHLLKRVGFSIDAVYGDFFRDELTSQSSEMIWLARNKVS